MPDPLLNVEDLNVTFPNAGNPVHAVRGVSYHVNPGEFLGIVGESGSGKSVSSLAVMGLLPSSAKVSGKVTFDGESLLDMNDRGMSKLRGADISMVFQDPLSALTPVYTIGQQIAEAIQLHDSSVSVRDAEDRAIELLKVVGIPAPERRARAFPHEFSGGMRQRVMIAMAIANDPKLIIADEPTTALDVTIQAQILEVLQEAKELTHAAVILITHDLGVVAGNVDRVAVMYAGRIVETGDVYQTFSKPLMPYTIGLLRSVPNMLTLESERLVPLEGRPPSLSNLPKGCPFAARCPAAIDVCRETEPDQVDLGEGRSVACHRATEIQSGRLQASEIFPRPEPVANAHHHGEEKILEVKDLVHHFELTKGVVFRRNIGTVRAVDGVSFELGRGETLGLVGESGCGKTTTVLDILEMTAPQSGQIMLGGYDIAKLGKAERRKLQGDVQIVFQDPMAAIDPRLPIGDIIAEPLTVQKVPKQQRDERVYELLDLVELDAEMISRYPHEFSGGQRQRIGIARALATNPKLLVLDEPVSALDVSVQAGVINLLEDLRDTLGLSYLFVAHDLAVVRHISDRIAVMYLGQIVEYGDVDEVYQDPKHPYTRALMSAVPVPDPAQERARERILLTGDLPSPAEELTGCRFRGRCPLYKILGEGEQTMCATDMPLRRRVGGVEVACHHAERNGLLDELASQRAGAGNNTMEEEL